MVKRTFYQDDELILNKPGVPIEPIDEKLKQEESTHGDVRFVDGMVIRSTPLLESYSLKFRKYLHDKLSILEAELGTQKSALQNEFSSLQSDYHQIVKEPLLPNIIYILTMSLSGSILVRTRNIGLRFITPIVFGGVTFNYTMPVTYNNLSNRYKHFESENYPSLASKRQEINIQYQNLRTEFYNQRLSINDSILSKVHQLRKFINDQIN